MLSPAEILLFQAVEEEQRNQAAQQAGGILGGLGGAAIGTGIGSIGHSLGQGLNALKGAKPNRLKPGLRMAGGLTGAILGGGLGAGAAALMKQNQAGELLGRIQATGEITPQDEKMLAALLGEAYSSPSKLV